MEELGEILKAYGASSSRELLRLIGGGKVSEHPAYEDYLEALECRRVLEGIKRFIEEHYSRIALGRPFTIRRRLCVVLKDGGFIDIKVSQPLRILTTSVGEEENRYGLARHCITDA